jgi:hypothetical protein
MSTQAQIDANRLNAQKSTGPVTATGREASCHNRGLHYLSNGSKFVVLQDEDSDEFYDVILAYQKIYDVLPDNPIEFDLIERMAEHEWMRCRAQRYMDNMFRCDPAHFANPLIPGTEKQFALMMRYYTMHERAFHTTLNALLKHRAETKKDKIGFERKKVQAEHLEMQKQRHQTMQRAKQIDADCKIIRALCKAANNPEALDLARGMKTSQQAA